MKLTSEDSPLLSWLTFLPSSTLHAMIGDSIYSSYEGCHSPVLSFKNCVSCRLVPIGLMSTNIVPCCRKQIRSLRFSLKNWRKIELEDYANLCILNQG